MQFCPQRRGRHGASGSCCRSSRSRRGGRPRPRLAACWWRDCQSQRPAGVAHRRHPRSWAASPPPNVRPLSGHSCARRGRGRLCPPRSRGPASLSRRRVRPPPPAFPLPPLLLSCAAHRGGGRDAVPVVLRTFHRAPPAARLRSDGSGASSFPRSATRPPKTPPSPHPHAHPQSPPPNPRPPIPTPIPHPQPRPLPPTSTPTPTPNLHSYPHPPTPTAAHTRPHSHPHPHHRVRVARTGRRIGCAGGLSSSHHTLLRSGAASASVARLSGGRRCGRW